MSWQVTVSHPSVLRPYVAVSAQETIMGAVGEVLHEFSMRTGRNLNEITDVAVKKVKP